MLLCNAVYARLPRYLNKQNGMIAGFDPWKDGRMAEDDELKERARAYERWEEGCLTRLQQLSP